jgi:membrane-bound ClpP family serine protease
MDGMNNRADRADTVKRVSLVIGVVFLVAGIAMGSPVPVVVGIVALLVFVYAYIQAGRS